MERVEEGVANFREFQADARDFFTKDTKDKERQKELDAKRAKIHYLLLTLLIGMVLAMFSFILSKLPNIHISLNPGVSYRQAPEHSSVDIGSGALSLPGAFRGAAILSRPGSRR